MNEAESKLYEIASSIAASLAEVRAERDHHRVEGTEGDDTALLDEALAKLDPAPGTVQDLAVFHSLASVVERYGIGPYPVGDLAAIIGVPVEDVQRVLDRLDQMASEGLATPPSQPPRDTSS